MDMKTINLGLSIFAKVQQISIRNEKIKRINQTRRAEEQSIQEFLRQNQPAQINQTQGQSNG